MWEREGHLLLFKVSLLYLRKITLGKCLDIEVSETWVHFSKHFPKQVTNPVQDHQQGAQRDQVRT